LHVASDKISEKTTRIFIISRSQNHLDAAEANIEHIPFLHKNPDIQVYQKYTGVPQRVCFEDTEHTTNCESLTLVFQGIRQQSVGFGFFSCVCVFSGVGG
jgi:hypothetical protein